MGFKGRNVLVTGAGGFVGSHLAEELVNAGANVTAFVRYNSRNDWGLLDGLAPGIKNSIEIIPGDLKDSDTVRRICRDRDVVFHLAALIAIPYSYVNPRDHVETNIIGTFNIMMGAKEGGVGKIVHTSTSEVYGTARYTPIDEGHPLQAQSPYSASKIAADKIAESFHLSYDLPVVTVRPFNTYGPRQSARAVIPTIISQALTGDEIRLGSLTPKRDLNYVGDTVGGFMMAAESKAAVGQVMNFGSGRSISIGDLVDKITKIMGKDYKIIEDEERIRPKNSEVMELMADSSKAKEILGWEPATGLDEGLRLTIEYIRDNIAGFKPDIYNI